MNYPTTVVPNDVDAITQDVRVLFGRSAEKVFKQTGGSARAMVEAARSQSGKGWDLLRAAQSIHERALLETTTTKDALTSPRVVRDFLTRRYGLLSFECFVLLMLDSRHRLLKVLDIFRGTVDGASVHPREVVREALQTPGCAALVLVHNHPSQICEPSNADEMITTRLRDALALVDIRIVDHVIVSGNTMVSLAERGLV